MSKLFELIHWAWIEAQLGSPPLIQDKVIPYLHWTKDTARLLLMPYMNIYEWRGHNESGPLTVSYAGLGFAAPFLKSILFTEEPMVTKTGKVPVWRPSALVNSSSGDIIVIEANKSLTRRLPNGTAVTMPFQVGFNLDVRGGWQDIRHRFHTSVRSYDLRLVRKYGYDYCVSYDDQSFDMFYQTMYLPTLLAKYDKLASPTPVEQARQYFRHGLLFLVRRDGQYVSGSLCSIQRETICPRLIGVINADKQLIKEGAQGAVYYAMIHWANRQGYEAVDLLGYWPFISSGVFWYKRKWGAAASLSPDEHKRIWIKVQRNTPAVFRFLSANPGVIIDQKGELRVLIVTEDPSRSLDEVEMRWDKFYAMPGIRGPSSAR